MTDWDKATHAALLERHGQLAATLARIRRLVGPGNCSTDWYQTDMLVGIERALEDEPQAKCACCGRDNCEVWGKA